MIFGSIVGDQRGARGALESPAEASLRLRRADNETGEAERSDDAAGDVKRDLERDLVVSLIFFRSGLRTVGSSSSVCSRGRFFDIESAAVAGNAIRARASEAALMRAADAASMRGILCNHGSRLHCSHTHSSSLSNSTFTQYV